MSSALHFVPGTIWTALAPLQLYRAISPSTTATRWHRACGYVFALCSVALGATGGIAFLVKNFHFGSRIGVMGGQGQVTVALLVLFWWSLVAALAAIRRGDVKRHREWIQRHVIIGLEVAVLRLLLILSAVISGILGLDKWTMDDGMWVFDRCDGLALCVTVVVAWLSGRAMRGGDDASRGRKPD